MKRILLLILILIVGCFNSPVLCADTTNSSDLDGILDNLDSWDGQKIITDQEFEKVMKKYENKETKTEKKKKKKLGELLTPTLNAGEIQSIVQMEEFYPTILIPLELISKEKEVPVGFYSVISAKAHNGETFINLYQGRELIVKLPARITEEDFEADTINFAKIVYEENRGRAKIIYGCIDYQLVAEVYTK